MAPFRHSLRVRYHECDPQGVVFNANYLAYFDIAITELWRDALGGWEQAMSESDLDLVVAEARVRYLKPLRFDEEVELLTRVAKLGQTSLVTAMAVERDGELVADGELRHVFVAGEKRGKVEIPDAVRAALERYS